MERLILHCDMNNFFASVEMIDKPKLRYVPMAVCGDPAMRHGIVLAKNELAKRYGVTTGEPSASAAAKCPRLVIVPPHYDKYTDYSLRARELYRSYTDKIYPYGIDEAWLDLSDMGFSVADGSDIADELRERIKKELKLTASVGVSFSYVFSKLASDMKKPDATTVLTREDMMERIWTLPASNMLFVGEATEKQLWKMGISTIGELACAAPKRLTERLGKKGAMLREFANGGDADFRPAAIDDDEIKSVGNSITPPKDIMNELSAAQYLYVLAGSVSARLKKRSLKASCVGVSLRRDDFSQLTRQRTLLRPTDDTDVIFANSYALLTKNHDFSRGLRSVGVRADKLEDMRYEQLSFFDGGDYPYIAGIDMQEFIAKVKRRSEKLSLPPIREDYAEVAG